MGDHAPHGGRPLSGETFSPEERESGRLLFARECRFVMGAVDMDHLPPPSLPEVAFAGRSNVGKSSLINALTRRKELARTSNTPGRTQELNFFTLDDKLMIADLPGYGYASAPKAKVENWTWLILDYLRGRPNLRRVLVLIDSRHGIKNNDDEVMSLLDQSAVPFQVVLTKQDKIKAAAREALMARTIADLEQHVAAHPHILATSSRKGGGIEEMRAALAGLAR
ncbi:ribosome biogenesis GTP-binding protein YihA/YsxC [Magnetospira sp. QH-2]|uniref:ribosome biogenesis GTP-binding protein YihA/YsxC n=1 Tax=Magnetospira sp. (strain QH-2) TaxID=1288970 RepID=UPI0018E0AB2B